ncbi:FCD domain-containing protein [Streptomyces sp. NPDC058469]|uniref:FCD domain-containing protein n=1 Tax=Streptomyces sp. NPDC058469 TaxID=3346514 RepID=UPI00364FB751
MAESEGALSAPTRRALFGTLTPTDTASAVVRRLRATIGLGFLSDGDKLPRESDLAKQLGVTSFTLREALGILRDEGLIITRAGKNGGSFVQRSTATTDLAGVELAQMSSAELRDLGDWRRMLTVQAAALAAHRASDANVERLNQYAGLVAADSDLDHARRAFGRFHLELAAAAQSARLSRAEITMHEEFDWIASLLLTDQADRRQCARGMRTITEAVRSRQPEAARAAAENHLSQLVRKLVARRLELIAAQHGTAEQAMQGFSSFPAEVRNFADQLLTQLRLIAEAVAEPLASNINPSDLHNVVGRAVMARLNDIGPAIDGIGVLAEVGTVAQHPYWLDWWHCTKTGPFERDTRHVLDPERDDFYDYELKEFIARPRTHRAPWATGPYVDYGGVDDYSMTFSYPISHDDQFLGISAIDVLAADMERHFAPWLAQAAGTCLLLNSESRVIVSNSATHNVGDVVRATAGLHVVPLDIFEWSLATAP